MAKIHAPIAGALLVLSVPVSGQRLDDAEVRIPYGELKQLLGRAAAATEPVRPEPALLSARLRLAMENGRPVIDATFRTRAFGDKPALLPLIAGDVALDKQGPEDAVLVVENQRLCLASDKAGTRILQLRLLPLAADDAFSITLPPCPSLIFETGDLPEGRSVKLDTGNHEETLTSAVVRPLPNNGSTLTLRLLDSRETREALLPPEPTAWTWQHEALVTPADGELIYQILARASATGGSGVAAMLPLPPDARSIQVAGEDLASHGKIRGENRSLALSLAWKTRDILDREVMVSYRMPLRPLDRAWRLQAPGGEGTRTRFIIATSPFLSYSAEGLSDPLTPQGLPAALAAALNGMSCRQIEAATTVELSATPIPLAATEEGVIKQAEWSLNIEPDGAMLATGTLVIDHKGPLGVVLETPDGMKPLTCELGGRPVAPVDLGAGRLKIALPPQEGTTRLTCSFTRSAGALDPVEGTLKLALPRTPLFIHTLRWQIDLPPVYQAETHGNLTRVASSGSPASRIVLAKNLCRDEGPETQLFYQRADINR